MPELGRCVETLAGSRSFAPTKARGAQVVIFRNSVRPRPRAHGLYRQEEGRERTEEEFRELYQQAGLKLTKVVPTPSVLSIVEGKRA